MTHRLDVGNLRLDLEHCAREPIHAPGAIQPHGCLVAFDRGSLVVQQVSANVEAFLGVSSAALLNRPLSESLPEGAYESLLQALLSRAQDSPLRLDVLDRTLDCLMHEHEGMVILEVEPAGGNALHDAALGESIRRLTTIETLQALFQETAQAVRKLTGFDRVIVYRFNDDGHGEVISEAKAPDVESYLGLHHPESDIPRQARALYLRHWIRNVPDAR